MPARLLAVVMGLIGVLGGSAHAQFKEVVPNSDFKVTLLGTGSPAPIMKRFGPGTLVQVNGQRNAKLGHDTRKMLRGLEEASSYAGDARYEIPEPVSGELDIRADGVAGSEGKAGGADRPIPFLPCYSFGLVVRIEVMPPQS